MSSTFLERFRNRIQKFSKNGDFNLKNEYHHVSPSPLNKLHSFNPSPASSISQSRNYSPIKFHSKCLPISPNHSNLIIPSPKGKLYHSGQLHLSISHKNKIKLRPLVDKILTSSGFCKTPDASLLRSLSSSYRQVSLSPTKLKYISNV